MFYLITFTYILKNTNYIFKKCINGNNNSIINILFPALYRRSTISCAAYQGAIPARQSTFAPVVGRSRRDYRVFVVLPQ